MNKKTLQTFAITTTVIAFTTVGSAAYAVNTGFERTGEERGMRERSEISMLELTDEQKALLAQIQTLRSEGDFEGAQALRESSDVTLPMGMRGGFGQGMNGMKGGNDEARAAIEANDYNAFVAAHVDSPLADKITPEMFAKMVEAHTLMQSGDQEGARALMEESRMFQGKGMGAHGMGMRGGAFKQAVTAQ